MPVDVQMIKSVPRPDWIPVLIQIDQPITQHSRGSWIAGQVSKVLVKISQKNHVPIGKDKEIMMESSWSKIIASLLHGLVQCCGIQLTNGISRQIHFA